MVAITSACRVSELVALAFKELFLVILSDKVVLQPQVDSLFHLNQALRNQALHTLNTVCAVKIHL